MTDARGALHRLKQSTSNGALDELCAALDVDVLGAFGSATRADASARDLDIGVRFNGPNRALELIDRLVELTGFDDIDVVVITGDHPAIEAAALAGTALYERSPGRFADEQMAAFGHARDTAWLRKLDLERLAR